MIKMMTILIQAVTKMAIMRYKLIKKQYDKNRNKTAKMLKINKNIKTYVFT